MNTKKSTKVTIDQLLFAAAFLLALVIRFMRLAHTPLADLEADLALQALGLAEGSFAGNLSGQPGYILPTTVLFAVFGAGAALARTIPALAGAALALTPALFTKQLGRLAALILAFGLALDPGLTALSRQASGFSWAVLFSVLTYASLKNKKAVLTGASFGLAILAGALFWHGLLGAVLGWGLYTALSRSPKTDEVSLENHQAVPAEFWRRAVPAALASLILVGSMFLFVPRGLSAIGNGLVEHIQGWQLNAAGESFPLLILALVVYETLGMVFALFQAVRVLFSREKKAVDLVLIFWWFAALLLGLLYPMRSEFTLGWSLIPMWCLAARCLSEEFTLQRLERGWFAAGQAAVLFILAISTCVSLGGLLDANLAPDEVTLRWVWAIGALLLGMASVLFVRWGSSKVTAKVGIIWGLTALLAIWSISSLFSAAGLAGNTESQLWQQRPAVYEGDLLIESISDISEWNTGLKNKLDLAVINISSPALEWALRDYETVNFYEVLPVGTSPSMVITREQASPELAEYYSGQDFVWEAQPNWAVMLPRDWFKWAVYKSAPVESDLLVFWVRTDCFPGSGQDLDD